MRNVRGASMDQTAPSVSWYAYQRRRFFHSEARAAYLYLAPAMIHLIAWVAFPVFYSMYLSLHRWDMLSSRKPWVGIGNYAQLIADPDFQQAFWNTVYYTVGALPLTIATALLLAVMLNTKLKGLGLFRLSFYMPVITSIIAASIVWMWIYEPNFGVLNFLLRKVGVAGPAWLTDPVWAMPAVIMMRIWKISGFFMVIYLGGLQGIPNEYYEAAVVDGATSWQSFWRITFPLLLPTTFLVSVLALIRSFQVFDQIYVMTQGGPMGTTRVLVYHLFEEAFVYFEMGRASATAYILFLVLFAVTLVQWKTLGKSQ